MHLSYGGKEVEVIMHCVQHWGLYELSVSGIDTKGACQMVAKEAKTWQWDTPQEFYPL